MALQSGRLRDRVTYQSLTSATDEGGGLVGSSFVDGDTVYARVSRIIDRRLEEGDQIESTATHRITVRGEPPTDVLKGRLKWINGGNVIFEILGLEDSERRGESTKYLCKEKRKDQ